LKTNKIYKKPASEFVDLVPPMGACLASDKITVDGELVDYMYREEPSNNVDCGWRFFSGTETQEYVDNPDNSAFYEVNTIANCDPAIIPYLHLPIGVELERVVGSDVFKLIDTN
jgi:hypothetical protein